VSGRKTPKVGRKNSKERCESCWQSTLVTLSTLRIVNLSLTNSVSLLERAIGRQIVKTKAVFDGSNLFPQKDDPGAPNHFRWAFNGNYKGFPANRLSLWSQPHILECFEALESDELYIEDLEKAPGRDEPKFQLARATEDAFRKHICMSW
jgi:hypothetical protein